MEENMTNEGMQEEKEETLYGVWTTVNSVDNFETLKKVLKENNMGDNADKLVLAENDAEWLNEIEDDDSIRKHVRVLLAACSESEILKAIEENMMSNTLTSVKWEELKKLFDAGYDLSFGRIG